MALQQVGAFAAKKDASEEARASYQAHFEELVGHPLEQLWARSIKYNDPVNWARGWRFVPSVVAGALEERNAEAELRAIQVAVDAKLVNPTRQDEAWARERLKMPPRPEEDDAEQSDTASIKDPVERLQQARLALPSGVFHLPDTAGTFRALVGLPPLAPGDAEAFQRIARGRGDDRGPVVPAGPGARGEP